MCLITDFEPRAQLTPSPSCAIPEAAFTRLLGWDVSSTNAVLKESFVLQLPVTNGKGKALAASDVRWLSTSATGAHTFVVLSRDGKGMGDDDAESKHKDFVLATTEGATNLVDSEYTTTAAAVAPDSKLVDGVSFVPRCSSSSPVADRPDILPSRPARSSASSGST